MQMKVLRIMILAALTSTVVGAADVYGRAAATAQTETVAEDAPKAKKAPKEKKKKLTREQRRAERERRITQRATEATQVKVRDGKNPSYNRLMKSTSYTLMYTEGLRYYNMKKKGKDYNSLANLRKAQTLFEAAVRSQAFSGSPQEDSLYYYLGDSYFLSKDFQMSQEIFDQFRRRYAVSSFVEEAEYKFAAGFYFLSPEPRHDQSITIRAMSAIAEFLGRYPDTRHREICEQRMEELRRKLYAKSYENARLYYTIGQYKAAVRALNNAIDEFPESPYREELMYLATRSAYLFARNSVPSQMTDRYLAMMDNYYNLISEYPETRYLREVERMGDEARSHIEVHTSADQSPQTTE